METANIINATWSPTGRDTETITVHAKVGESDTFRVFIQLDPSGDIFKVKYRATDETNRIAMNDLMAVLTAIRVWMRPDDESPVWDALVRMGKGEV
jgi:hypothetical protein